MEYGEAKKFLEKENPCDYDFKYEGKFKIGCKDEDYKNLSSVEKFLIYKAVRGNRIESEEKYPNAIKFQEEKKEKYPNAIKFQEEKKEKYNFLDTDGSDGRRLTQDIYSKLWNWEKNKNENFGKIGIDGFENKESEFGGDSMNSVLITMNKYMKFIFDAIVCEKGDAYLNLPRQIKEALEKRGKVCLADYLEVCGETNFWKVFYEKIDEKGEYKYGSFREFVEKCFTIGNFILVPGGFNTYRNSKVKDYWDLSLVLMKNENEIGNKIIWDEKNFDKYINIFFLWDYVEVKDKEYRVKPLFNSHENRINKDVFPKDKGVLPKDEMECNVYFNKVNRYIERRGHFMVAMLKIALNFDEETQYNGKYYESWEGWKVSGIYKEIMEKVFMKENALYSGFEKVTEEIKRVVKNLDFSGEDIKNKVEHILNELEEELLKADENRERIASCVEEN